MGEKTVETSESILEQIPAIKESYEICKEVGIVNKLSKRIVGCKEIYETARNDLGPYQGPIFTRYFFITFASFLHKCYSKGQLDDLEIKKEFEILKKERGDRCFHDLAHCITNMLVCNGDVTAELAVS